MPCGERSSLDLIQGAKSGKNVHQLLGIADLLVKLAHTLVGESRFRRGIALCCLVDPSECVLDFELLCRT